MTGNKPTTRIIRKAELRRRIGYSDVHIWRLERAGNFPQRVHIGPNSIGWVEAEVEAWLQQKIDARGAG
jgi:prophage regulatory protein